MQQTHPTSLLFFYNRLTWIPFGNDIYMEGNCIVPLAYAILTPGQYWWMKLWHSCTTLAIYLLFKICMHHLLTDRELMSLVWGVPDCRLEIVHEWSLALK